MRSGLKLQLPLFTVYITKWKISWSACTNIVVSLCKVILFVHATRTIMLGHYEDIFRLFLWITLEGNKLWNKNNVTHFSNLTKYLLCHHLLKRHYAVVFASFFNFHSWRCTFHVISHRIIFLFGAFPPRQQMCLAHKFLLKAGAPWYFWGRAIYPFSLFHRKKSGHLSLESKFCEVNRFIRYTTAAVSIRCLIAGKLDWAAWICT